jgi:hypothetical protein
LAEREDGPAFAIIRLMINLGALGVSAAIVALIVATIITEMD